MLQVYLTLCFTLVFSAAGAYLHFLWNIGGLLTTIACFGSILWLFSTPAYQEVFTVDFCCFLICLCLVFLVFTLVFYAWCFLGKQKKKFSLLMAAATFEGASLGPLFDLANAVDPRYVWPINQSVAIVTCSIYLC